MSQIKIFYNVAQLFSFIFLFKALWISASDSWITQPPHPGDFGWWPAETYGSLGTTDHGEAPYFSHKKGIRRHVEDGKMPHHIIVKIVGIKLGVHNFMFIRVSIHSPSTNQIAAVKMWRAENSNIVVLTNYYGLKWPLTVDSNY